MITKEIWQSGKFRELPEFATQKGYYNEIRKFIDKYGKPTTKDMLLVRSGSKEETTRNYGASWTPNINVCRKLAKYFNLSDTIYVTFVPAGTMAVHIPPKDMYEEEYVLDMEGKADSVEIIAKHTGEWDWTTDFETDKDYDNWELLPTNITRTIAITNKKILKKLFEEEQREIITLTEKRNAAIEAREMWNKQYREEWIKETKKRLKKQINDL